MSNDIKKIYEETKDLHLSEKTTTMSEFRAQLKEKMGKKAQNKEKVTMRLDADVLEAVKELAGEGPYQSLINTLLREAVETKKRKVQPF